MWETSADNRNIHNLFFDHKTGLLLNYTVSSRLIPSHNILVLLFNPLEMYHMFDAYINRVVQKKSSMLVRHGFELDNV